MTTPPAVALGTLAEGTAFRWATVHGSLWCVTSNAGGRVSYVGAAYPKEQDLPADYSVVVATAAECAAWLAACAQAALEAVTAYSAAELAYLRAGEGLDDAPGLAAHDAAVTAAQAFGAALVAREQAARQTWIARRALMLAQQREGAGDGR